MQSAFYKKSVYVPNQNGTPVSRALDTINSEGAGTAIRGLGGVGLGYLIGKYMGDHGTVGAILGGAAGLSPEIIKYAPKAIDAVKGLFSKNAAALAVVSPPMRKQASVLTGLAALQAANNMRHMGHTNVDVNAIQVPEGALPPEELLLPEVKREGRKAAIKSVLKNIGIGTLLGGGSGALLGALSNDTRKSKEFGAAGGALLGALLGGTGGLVSAAWNAPDARLEAMKAKHNELHGIG